MTPYIVQWRTKDGVLHREYLDAGTSPHVAQQEINRATESHTRVHLLNYAQREFMFSPALCSDVAVLPEGVEADEE